MRFERCTIPGCFEVIPPVLRDRRGTFVKTYREDLFAANGVSFSHTEEYFTFSNRGVLRGLHFQVPPKDYVKIVCCVSGEALDAIVDLRIGSPTYGRYQTFVLSADFMRLLYLPKGVAHGFYVTGGHALMHYTVSAPYSPEHDTGILWNSAGIPWPDAAPIISDRDGKFAPLSAFDSPFLTMG